MFLWNIGAVLVAICGSFFAFSHYFGLGGEMVLWWLKDDYCSNRHYTTQIVSENPLLVYIDGFITEKEASRLLEIGRDQYAPSRLSTGTKGDQYRTSQSAGLPPSELSVSCIGKRALSLMGSFTKPSDDFGIPQLVNYSPGQQYKMHYDWFKEPMEYKDGRFCNRAASFFVFLEANCTGGETHFPRITSNGSKLVTEGKAVQSDSFDGIMFKPIPGNALFWINLHDDGTGDERVLHGGLTVHTGSKTGMNIWPLKCGQ